MFTFFQTSWAVSPFLSSLVWKGTPFAKNVDVKWKQMTYHIMQISVNQILQASLSNFKIITVTNYCEKKRKVFLLPLHSPRLNVFSKNSRSEFDGIILFRERLVMCSFYYIITQLYTTNLMFKWLYKWKAIEDCYGSSLL